MRSNTRLYLSLCLVVVVVLVFCGVLLTITARHRPKHDVLCVYVITVGVAVITKRRVIGRADDTERRRAAVAAGLLRDALARRPRYILLLRRRRRCDVRPVIVVMCRRWF